MTKEVLESFCWGFTPCSLPGTQAQVSSAMTDFRNSLLSHSGLVDFCFFEGGWFLWDTPPLRSISFHEESNPKYFPVFFFSRKSDPYLFWLQHRRLGRVEVLLVTVIWVEQRRDQEKAAFNSLLFNPSLWLPGKQMKLSTPLWDI